MEKLYKIKPLNWDEPLHPSDGYYAGDFFIDSPIWGKMTYRCHYRGKLFCKHDILYHAKMACEHHNMLDMRDRLIDTGIMLETREK